MSKQKKPVAEEISEGLIRLEEELALINPDIFNGINSKKKTEILQSFSVTLIQEKSHSEPLPDPKSLRQYDAIIPNEADRIMAMAEKQQEHRMSFEKSLVKNQFGQSKLGQIFGLVIGLVGILSGTYLASTGEATLGGVIAGGTVISLVSVFVIGRKSK